MSLRRYRQIAIVTVAGVCFLTVAGAVVRLTGSGLGCDDWPNCNDERFIDVSSGQLMAIGAFRVRPERRGLKVPSLMVLVTILGNGVVGGMAVRGDLHPTLVQSHFILAMISIGFGLVAIHRSGPESVGRRESIGVTPLVTGLMLALGALVAAALVTGTVVTGAGPHAGDETARRYGFDISTVAEIHCITVWVAVAVFLVLVVAMRRTPGMFDVFAGKISTWMFLAVLQGGVGYLQYFNDVPATLVAAHVAGATALWVATVWLVASGLEPVSRLNDGESSIEPVAVFDHVPTSM